MPGQELQGETHGENVSILQYNSESHQPWMVQTRMARSVGMKGARRGRGGKADGGSLPYLHRVEADGGESLEALRQLPLPQTQPIRGLEPL